MIQHRPKLYWRTVAAVGLIYLCSGSAAGQEVAHRFEVFAEAGASTFTSSSSVAVEFMGSPPQASSELITTTSLSTTGRIFMGLRYWFGNKEAFEASYSYSPSDLTQTQNCVSFNGTSCTGFDGTEISHHHFISFNYVRSIPAGKRLSPFLTGGIGFVYVHEPLFSPTHFAANFGGGVDVRVSQHWALRAEYRDFMLDVSQLSTGNPTGLTHNQVPSVGLVFRF
ncbi:MAG TPA: outer membrane beta-barrel protein [Candidatus Acidoferrales bacterium]|nr:outer membrane beta-barrel protein [Candidatus Acidoferrales bacterium]